MRSTMIESCEVPGSQKIERTPRERCYGLRASAVQCSAGKVVCCMYIGSVAVPGEPLPVVLLLFERDYRRAVQTMKDELYARRDRKCLLLSGFRFVSVAKYVSGRVAGRCFRPARRFAVKQLT